MNKSCSWLLLSVVAAGCAHNSPLPLPLENGLARSVSQLAGTPGHRPLSVQDVTLLALDNNPDLRATRSQRGVAQAQLLQAGLLPNPTLTSSILPLAAGVGTTIAWNAGLGTDVTALVTLSARRRGAAASAGHVDAQIVWQEWQMVGQARLLAIDVIEGDNILDLLRRQAALLDERVARSRRAVATGDATLTTLAPDVAAQQATRVQLQDQERLVLAKRHQLAALLNLVPDAELPLVAEPDLPTIDVAAAQAALPTLADRRPDLVALRLGYAAQDEKLRAAILAQFPKLIFGAAGGSDNANVRNVGPQITLELPLFDRNQGNIAIERATRQQLHAEYAARLAAASGQVAASASEIQQLREQLARAERERADTARMARNAQAALAQGGIDERSYVDLVTTDIAKEVQIATLRQALLEQEVAIETNIGAGMPTFTLQPDQVSP